jgi:hypothetical protein
MANDDIWMVVCDGHTIQRAMTEKKAYAFAKLMQEQADYSHGTKIRNSEFQVKRDMRTIAEEDALYKHGKRRTLVVRP